MDVRPAAPPSAKVAKADPDPIAVEFLSAQLPMHVQAFLAEVKPDSMPAASSGASGYGLDAAT